MIIFFNEIFTKNYIFIIFFLQYVHANIVDELTSLNNLYKDGVITKKEFIQAKSMNNTAKEMAKYFNII